MLIDEVFTFLFQITSNPTSPASVTLNRSHIEAIISILDRWPAAQRFPGMCCHFEESEFTSINILTAVMDLCRLVVAYPLNALTALGSREKLFDHLFNASDWSSVVSRGSPMLKPQETNVLLLLRTIANCFQEDTLVNEGQWVQQVNSPPSLALFSNWPSRYLRLWVRHHTTSFRSHNE